MNLLDCITRIDSLDPDATLWTREPWTPSSETAVEVEPDEGGLPPSLAGTGLVYFLEVDVALEVLEGFTDQLKREPTDDEKCARLIRYATDDA